jgi:hypothetical protein
LTKNPETRIKSIGELLALVPGRPAESVGNALRGVPGIGDAVHLGTARNATEGVPYRGANEGVPNRNGAIHNAAVQSERESDVDIIPASVVPEEPLWRAVRTAWRRFTNYWGSVEMTGGLKVIVILASIYCAFHFLLPLVAFAAVALPAYAGYYIVRLLVLDSRPAVVHRAPPPIRPVPRTPRPAPVAPAAVAPARPVPPAVPTRPAPPASPPPPKTVRQRLEELTGSLLAATAVAAVMSVFLSVVHAKTLEPGQFAWLLLVSTLGSWLVLVFGKFWEGHEGDSTLRRLMLMVLGLGLGAAAWGLKDFLYVSLSADWRLPPPVTEKFASDRFFDSEGAPTLVTHMAYFAFLMLVVRWWKLADPARPARLRLWPVLATGFWAWVLYFFWPFPQPWGAMVAASMAIAVQLAASWESPKGRRAS